jgi:uncharacterized membrane-anchored protein
MNQVMQADTKSLLNKVPEVTLYFWIIKVLATTVGETAADFLNFNLNFCLTGTSVVMAALLFAFLVAQVREHRYVPWLYWATVVLISIVGTLFTDNLTDNLNVALAVTTGVFSGALLATFGIWYWRERTLSIHTIVTRTRELFYWAAILFTFALGTAAGDLVAESMNLGYGVSALLFGAMIVAVAAAHYGLKMNAVLAFWLAYVLTRPLGASFGDLLSQPVADGGIGLGTVVTSGLFLAAITGLVLLLTVTRKDVIEAKVAS